MNRAWIVLLLVSAQVAVCETQYYRSNSAGMMLERIEWYRRDEHQFVLSIEKAASGEARRLYAEGKETRRWEVVQEESAGRKTETEYSQDQRIARRTYGAGGEMISEESYADGKAVQKSLYTYAAGRLSRLRVLEGDGTLLYSEEYSYTTAGALRDVRRVYADGGLSSASVRGGASAGIAEERSGVGEVMFVSRYDAQGRLVSREERRAEEWVSRQDYSFTAGVLESSRLRTARDAKEVSRSYDGKGRVASETVLVMSKLTEETRFAWDGDDRLTEKVRQSAAGREQWIYSYDPSDGRTTREEYRLRGALEKITVYTDAHTRVEELYQGGALFLKVFYLDDTRIKEQIYDKGVMLRERSF